MYILIEKINNAISKAENLQSKLLNTRAYEVPALASLKIRNLLNNLGELCTNYMECGVHVGGSFCSSLYSNYNIKNAYAIDSWASDHMQGEVHEIDFRLNVAKFIPRTTNLKIIKSDCFDVHLSEIEQPIDFYLYDAGHSREDQANALIYYKPVLANNFIFCVDDYGWGEVKQGTLDGIKNGGFEIISSWELLNETQGDGHYNDEWWRGYGVFLLKKISNG